MKLYTDQHGPQRIKLTDVGDPLTFPLAPAAGQKCPILSLISWDLFDKLAPNVFIPRCFILIFGIFHLKSHQEVDMFVSERGVLPTGWTVITLLFSHNFRSRSFHLLARSGFFSLTGRGQIPKPFHLQIYLMGYNSRFWIGRISFTLGGGIKVVFNPPLNTTPLHLRGKYSTVLTL